MSEYRQKTGWPQASAADNAIGWTLDYKFLEKVEALAKTRTEYSTSMEATEQVLIAAMEVLAAAPKAEPAPAGEYPPLPWGSDFEEWLEVRSESAVHDAFRAYVDADRAMRAQAAPATVAPPKAQEAEAVAEVTRNRPDNYSSNHRIRWLSQKTYPVGTKLYTSAPVPAAVAGPSEEQITKALRAAGFFDTQQSRRDMTAALMAALAAAPSAQAKEGGAA